MRILASILFCISVNVHAGALPFWTKTSPLLRNLSGLWRMEETSGTRYDYSTYGNDLSSSNSVGEATGKVSNASVYSTPDQRYLTRASNTSLQTGPTDFTLAGWFIFTNCCGSQGLMLIGKDAATSGNREFTLEINNSLGNVNLFQVFKATDSGVFVSVTGSPVDSTWYFIAAWHDSVNKAICIQRDNGTIYTNTYSGTLQAAGNANFKIGARDYASSPAYYDGMLDEIGMWKRVLTASERTQLYNAGLGTHYPWAHP